MVPVVVTLVSSAVLSGELVAPRTEYVVDLVNSAEKAGESIFLSYVSYVGS
jgi:hypothetical protein